MKNYSLLGLLLVFLCFPLSPAHAQRSKKKNQTTNRVLNDSVLSGLKLRNIGPAFMSGRISHIAIHPDNENVWYVAVGSGGVWKTVNSGTTWTPIFDNETSYSIGTVTIDPNNPETIWVGTGEDVGGRHVGFGDGVYRSDDGGKSWKNMGLKDSQHISRIVVHPDDSDTVWVTAQGPLWNKGGDRGLFKTTDGGKTWTKTLGDSEWTGVTDLELDPNNMDRLYAATWQHHRTVAAYMGGGPKSGIYRSDDGGETWTELENGLPKSNMGKIGLAVSPHDSNTIYAAIELNRRKGGLFMSTDGGNSWTKQSDAVSGGTGPHYYQELFVSPHHEGRLYLMDASMQVSDDAGKTFYRMNERNKHGDNHAIAFKSSDPDYVIMGTDGGLYESFDLTETWKFVDNLPITQYYKVAVDDAKPFYNIYGGTQDNSTQGGPSRTDNVHGIQNSDWRVVLNWDGHQPATEPGNPDIIYGERQEGTLSRIDMSTGEVVDIQPQPAEGEDYERFNWDAPILVSPHNPTTIYFASQRVWKSDNRGDSWTAISGDLTKDQERIELPIMGKKQSWDGAWDMFAMSNYNTITSLAESPKQAGLVYAGTDDGLIQVTEKGGGDWRKINVGDMPGVPATAFVNDIKADLFDANTVYVALDNHKYGDFNPYLMKSTDRGRSWKSISNNLPDRTLVWRLVQDHEKPGLMFAATEFGIYFTVDGGQQWTELQGGVPTISFRDLAIQRRENDLVAASFGRGFFILDDYSALREISEATLQQDAKLFETRDAWWYIPRPHLGFDADKGSQGDSHYVAPNPEFGAVFTYYLKDGLKKQEDVRQEKEKQLGNQDVPFPGWDALQEEKLQQDPKVIIAVANSEGQVIRRISGPAKKGVHRIAWDLRYPPAEAITMRQDSGENESPQGLLAPPGTYTATMYLSENGTVSKVSQPITFDVKPLKEGALKGSSKAVASDFWRLYETSVEKSSALNIELNKSMQRAKAMHQALERSQSMPGELDSALNQVIADLNGLNAQLNGNLAKLEVGEKTKPTVGERMFAVYRGIERSTYGPTPSQKDQMQIINKQLEYYQAKLSTAQQKLDVIYGRLRDAGAPYVEK
ncbi:MAG: glycosyl hydrolase [Flavobacteriaceae bacterium]|nr:glycosyl hydrolase [Flavobacteriaceae bacterium]